MLWHVLAVLVIRAAQADFGAVSTRTGEVCDDTPSQPGTKLRQQLEWL